MAEPKQKKTLQKKNTKESAAEEQPKKTLWVQIRLFPIWLRIILVLVLLVLAAVLGVMVGYGMIGDGEPSDALKWETWQHILDLMSGQS